MEQKAFIYGSKFADVFWKRCAKNTFLKSLWKTATLNVVNVKDHLYNGINYLWISTLL